jgi:hypothetical protein
MTFLPIEDDAISPFTEWYQLRDELVPRIGERAFSLFAHAICEESGGVATSARFRKTLVESGNDVDNPQVTETEQLLIEWGRLIALDPHGIALERYPQFERAFSPQLRLSLVSFAGIMLATNIVRAVGRLPVPAELLPFRAPGDTRTIG